MNNDQLRVVLLIGAPGSGKDTYLKSASLKPDTEIISTDKIRGELTGDENNQTVSAQAFSIARQRMDFILKNNKGVIINATNMYRKSRKDFLQIAKKYNAYTIATVFEVDKNTLIERNKKRGAEGGRNVPEEVIQRMIDRYERPTLEEFDNIQFVVKNDQLVQNNTLNKKI